MVRLWDHHDSYGEVSYKNFKILSEADNYTLSLGPLKRNEEQEKIVLNTAHDSFSIHNMGRFSTKDKDNDISIKNRNIAAMYMTAGWFQNENSIQSNLFGLNMNTIQTKSSWMGMSWKSFRGSRYSLRQLTMSIRPKMHIFRGKCTRQHYRLKQ